MVLIARTFPSDQSIYRAVHKEEAYKSRKNGELIPYFDADRIRRFRNRHIQNELAIFWRTFGRKDLAAL